MKKFKFNKKIVATLVIVSFVLGFVGLNSAQAVVIPPALGLGAADGYSVYGHAGITNTTGPTSPTRVWGSVGDNNISGDTLTSLQVPSPGIINHSTEDGLAIEADARSVYLSLMDASQGTPTYLNLAGTHTIANGNPITPGVYNVEATTLNGAVELSGAGVYIFRSSSSLTVATSGGTMALRNGATACNVFWAVPASMTIGTDSKMIGTIIASTGLISLGTGASLVGRAISLTKAVTLDNNQITEPTCVAGIVETPLVVRRSSSGSIPRVIAPVFQPSITILSTPVVIVPKLPKTGFAPQESGIWYESLLNNILNLFK